MTTVEAKAVHLVAERYADQSEQDHAALAAAAGAGRIPVVAGV